MKKVLFGGGSHAEIPMIEEAKKAGWYVITTGNNRDGLGHKYADEYIPGDFSDKEFITDLASKKKVNAIVSGTNDFSYISTAYACEKLGLKGHDSYEKSLIIHHKDKFRNLTRSLGIKTPFMYECYDLAELDEIIDKISYPVLVKPVDLTGGKGVKVCNNETDVKLYAKEAFELTRQDHIIIEEFIFGSNHGSSFIIKNQKVIYSIFDDEQYGKNKYLVLGASAPSEKISNNVKTKLIEDINKIAKKLELVDGLFHAQFIVTDMDEPVIIDPCRRAPGDLYVLLAKYHTGVNYPKEILNGETGNEISDNYALENNVIARECIMAEKEGVFESIYIDSEVEKHIIYKMVWAKPGDVIKDIMKYKAGILIMRFDTSSEMKKVLDNYSSLVKIVYKEQI